MAGIIVVGIESRSGGRGQGFRQNVSRGTVFKGQARPIGRRVGDRRLGQPVQIIVPKGLAQGLVGVLAFFQIAVAVPTIDQALHRTRRADAGTDAGGRAGGLVVDNHGAHVVAVGPAQKMSERIHRSGSPGRRLPVDESRLGILDRGERPARRVIDISSVSG